eukprot:664427-Prymnesium_polylepis.1
MLRDGVTTVLLLDGWGQGGPKGPVQWGPAEFTLFALGFEGNTTLRILGVGGFMLDVAGCKVLAKCLEGNTTLQELQLQ